MTALNPVYPIGRQIAEVLAAHTDLHRRARHQRVLELLDLVALPDPARRFYSYPHELSGGQRQRVVIAMAIALSPRLLIADEPTTALDATIRAQILELLDRLRRGLSMGLLLISHDLPVVSRWTDRVLVMHHGEKIEALAAADLFETGQHPYTRGLIGASIRLSDDRHYTTGALSEICARRDAAGDFSFDLHRPASAPPQPQTIPAEPLLRVQGLSVDYTRGGRPVRAVDDISFQIGQGETLGLVGESGSGKSSLSKALLRLVPAPTGQITLAGQDITALSGTALRQRRRDIQMVFQDPYGSLNPRHTVQDILAGTLAAHGEQRDAAPRIAAMLDRVGLPRDAANRHPHEFSGGQRQRIAIARALILKPKLVICDEPVSALDVSIQAQILNLLVDLKREDGLSYLFISHDLAVVQYISDRVMVMKDGRLIETADHRTIWRHPQHPYTRNLIAALA